MAMRPKTIHASEKAIKGLRVGSILFVGATTNDNVLERPTSHEEMQDVSFWTRCKILGETRDKAKWLVEDVLSDEDKRLHTRWLVDKKTLGSPNDSPIIDWFYSPAERKLVKKRELLISEDASLIKMKLSDVAGFVWTETPAEQTPTSKPLKARMGTKVYLGAILASDQPRPMSHSNMSHSANWIELKVIGVTGEHWIAESVPNRNLRRGTYASTRIEICKKTGSVVTAKGNTTHWFFTYNDFMLQQEKESLIIRVRSELYMYDPTQPRQLPVGYKAMVEKIVDFISETQF